MSFDPNKVGISNGNIFGFPVAQKDANQVIISIPWDLTTSYRKGASFAPRSILNESLQLDFFHHKLSNAHQTKVFFSELSSEWKNINNRLSEKSIAYLTFLEEGGSINQNIEFKDFVNTVNQFNNQLKESLYKRAKDLLDKDVLVSVLGGEHSVPLGLILALDEKYSSFGILQIDAHCDLRDSYQDFDQSHASIMYNVLKECNNLTKLVQVGVRDFSSEEFVFSDNNDKIKTFFDATLKEGRFKGLTWDDQVNEIISELPEHVYISFDIDGLCPYLCPSTGTPVPGGLEFDEAIYLIFKIVESQRKIIGFDLSEVSIDSSSKWDANVGARVLWNLVCAAEKSRK